PGATELRGMSGHGCSRVILAVTLLAALAAGEVRAQPAVAPSPTVDNPLQIPDLSRVVPPATTREGLSNTLQIFIIMTVLTLAPAILVMTTSFTRIMIVLALLRQ